VHLLIVAEKLLLDSIFLAKHIALVQKYISSGISDMSVFLY